MTTLRCPDCDNIDVELIDDNGAEYPETRVETFRCHHCGRSFTEVLTA